MDDQLPLFRPLSTPEPADLPLESPPGPPTPSVALGPATSLSAAIVAWQEHMRAAELSLNTIKAFGGDLRQLAQYLGPGRAEIGGVSTRDLNHWLQAQRAAGVSPKTYARRVTSLKSFFRWLVEAGVLTADPAAPVIQQTVLSPLPEILTETEVQWVLRAAEQLRSDERPDPRPQALVTLLLQTGIKKGECLELRLNHVDLSGPDGPVLWIRYPARARQRQENNQRYKERKLRLDPGWRQVFEAYRAYLDEPANAERIPDSRKDRVFPWSARRLEYMLEDIGSAAGLQKHLSFDMCRWTCAVRDVRAGIEADRLRQKLGLSKIQWREVGMKLKKLTEPAL